MYKHLNIYERRIVVIPRFQWSEMAITPFSLSLSLLSFRVDRSRSRFRTRGPRILFRFPPLSLRIFFFFFFLSRTMLFHLHSVFTSRAFHASRLFLFAQLSFFSCLLPLVYSFSTFYSLVPSLLFFVTLPSRPFPLFSRLSFANQTCWLFLSSFFLDFSDIFEPR